MGQHRDLETRLAQAEKMVDRNDRSAERHARAAKRHKDKGEDEEATRACRLHDRAVRLKRKWQREVRRLSTIITTRRVLQARAPKIEHPVEPKLTPKQQHEKERSARSREAKAEERRKTMSAAGIDYYDDRTAHGRRSYDIASLGPSLRVSVNQFNACIRKKADRTNARVLAWSKVERHCHRVNQGLLPAPRFEPGIDSSLPSGVSDSRLDALKQDARLRAWLGRDMHGLLVSVIYEGRSFRDLEETSCLEEKLIAALFLRALDEAACFWRVGEDNSFGAKVNAVLHRSEIEGA